MPAQHIDHKEIVIAVAIQITKINAHGKMAGGSPCQAAQRLEMTFAIIDPTPIRSEGIVTDVDIRSAIAVDIAKNYGQPLVPRSLLQRFSFFVQESSIGPGNRFEISLPIV